MRTEDLHHLPPNLPVPVDDGAARHLPGTGMPDLGLTATDGSVVRLDDPARAVTVVFCYPRTGVPDRDPLGGLAYWNSIPGARGCTPQTCAYRDRFAEFRRFGAAVFGLSTQTPEDQREAATRLQLPFALLSDPGATYADRLRLPTFTVEGIRLIKRLTLIIRRGRIAHCFYPVFPSDRDAETVLGWLRTGAADPTPSNR